MILYLYVQKRNVNTLHKIIKILLTNIIVVFHDHPMAYLA